MPNNLFWAGCDTSYESYVSAVEKFSSLSPEAFGSPVEQEETIPVPRLYSTAGSVAIISISGALVNKESWWTRWAGMTSYESIREALIYALSDESVDKILMDISSPGGQVSGCEDCANLVSAVSDIKQVSVFSDATVASAAYWIASAGFRRYTTKSALWGSIGVIMRHAENSKMRKDAGIKDTIFRSGAWKGIGGGEEKLSQLAIDDFQEKTEYLADVFVQAVADNLNITAAYVDQTMGQGREFVGQQAVDVGLCSSVESFDAVVSKLQEAAESAGGIIMPKKSLTPQAIAAMAVGATPGAEASSDVPVADDVETKEEGTPEAEASTDKTVEVVAEDGTPEAEASTEEDSGAELTSVLAKNELLTEQLATSAESNLELKMEVTSLKEDVESMDALASIAAQAVNNMQVALGQSAQDLKDYSPKDLVSIHGSTLESFNSTFIVGGVADASSSTETEPAKVEEIPNLGAVGM